MYATCVFYFYSLGKEDDPNDADNIEKLDAIVDAESENYYSADEYDAQKGITAYSFSLVDGMMPKRVSDNLKGALDQMCPALKSSSKLQEKAMRIVLSQGTECVLVDSDVSSALGKIDLDSSELLTAEETDQIMGTFAIPDLTDPKYK